ncbi:MAG: hypothetical protein CR982_02395 [Candidatus Cloacimonadota bacterium]|nr:MAG: hypothetical protein CR982_02395 [Candidatus Cloacimonadota bacterium]PIE78547.1 MAG: hypothetical protein CSA15_07585 [Candidatus Delongbacteria bacterium]
MAKSKCPICNKKIGKRSCKIEDRIICPVCCAKMRDEEKCLGCKYFENSVEHEAVKKEKATSKIGTIFGSPEMQKSIMEASIDLMNNHPEKGKLYDKDAEAFTNDSYALFNTEEFKDFKFEEKEIKHIILKLGEPGTDQEWFFTQEGTDYFTKATEMIVDEVKYKSFSQALFRIFIKYYTIKDIDKSWIILGTINRLMEGEYVLPFTTLMFFRGLAEYRANN